MVKIIADSTCDLSPELIEKYNISIIPLHIILADEEYEDGVGITPDEIYKWSDEHKTTPKTSAAAMDTIARAFEPYKTTDDTIICFSISEQMSTNANVMRLVAEDMEMEDRVFVIDSANLSTGIGLLVIEAAILASQGLDATDYVSEIENLKPMVRASFVVDTLTYLHRGGRCNSVAALAGGMLRLHPRIEVADGKMDAGKKYRGKYSGVVLSYVKDMENDLLNAKKDRVFITHSGCDENIINSVKEYLESLNYFDEILITRAGCVISSHCGYGTLGVLFIAQ